MRNYINLKCKWIQKEQLFKRQLFFIIFEKYLLNLSCSDTYLLKHDQFICINMVFSTYVLCCEPANTILVIELVVLMY